MWRWSVIALALFSIADQGSANKPVYFQSRDFNHTLLWRAVRNSTEQPALYSVQHKIYGEDDWTDKKECQNITTRSCDLTTEMSDIRNYYYARVTTNGDVLDQSPRFQPLRDTVLSPPVVRVFPGVRLLKLVVSLPTMPDLVFPEPVSYQANLTYHNSTHKISVIEMTTSSSVIQFERLQNDTEYEVSVRYVFPVRKQSEVSQQAVKTLAISERKDLYAIPAALALAIMLLAFLVFCQMFVSRKPPLPVSLDLEAKFPASSNVIAVIHIPEEEISAAEPYTRVIDVCPDGKPRPAPKPRGDDSYAPQDCDPDDQSGHCHSYASQQGARDGRSASMQSSTIYSQVFVTAPGKGGAGTPKADDPAPPGAGLRPGEEPARVEGRCRPHARNLDPTADEGARTLVVPASRGVGGALQLLFSFQQEKQEEEEEEEEEGPGEAAGADASSGTSYLPNGPPPTAYASQQAWTPEPHPGWTVPSDGLGPSGYRGNAQEAEALLPPSPQDADPTTMGAGAGAVRGYLSQVFSEAWGLWIQE
ncbi:interleukin-20 receptor subunit alpha-like [Conger conger]|uniref:interleukin-20 receptor subunit alpha-like n=1 Tax=Conger conger TaxID=82655 RepID=UPI002A5AA3EB|nr:interleukin-20 receptor subunit alpha-like [Conger conger]